MKTVSAILAVTGIILMMCEAKDVRSQMLTAVVGVMMACVGGYIFSSLGKRDDE